MWNRTYWMGFYSLSGLWHIAVGELDDAWQREPGGLLFQCGCGQSSAPVQFLLLLHATAPGWAKAGVTCQREKLSLTVKLITQGILRKTHELSLFHCSLPGRSSLCLSSATALKLPHPKRPMGKNAMGLVCFGSRSSQTTKMVHNQL